MSVEKIGAGYIEQLQLNLDINDVADDAEVKSISFDEARIISENACTSFEKNEGGIAWHPDYWRLRNQGWPWRVAAYIAWAASPKQERWPKTQDELATQMLGLTSDRIIATWRKRNPAIDEVIALLQVAPLFEHRSDIFDALIKSATNSDYKNHPDRKLALEMLGDYVPRAKVDLNEKPNNDLGSMSDAELENLGKKLGLLNMNNTEGESAQSPASQGPDEPGGDDVG